jgi:signal transduction histidine kinase/DNA-binding response OmpR family regulator
MLDKVNILIVDDLAEKLLVLESVLEELGQNVIAARNGSEALRRVMEHDFAVILLDVNMPDMDGYETATLIRKRKKSAHTPIIFVTSYADEVHTSQGYKLGAVDYIVSPVMPEMLRSKVKVFVDLALLTQQIQRQAQEQVALAREQAARSAAEQTVQRLNFLAEASKTLASSLDLEATSRGVLGLVVPRHADLGVIALLDEAGRLGPTELAWVDVLDKGRSLSLPRPEALHTDFADALVRVVGSGKPEHLGDALPHLFNPLSGSLGVPQRECSSVSLLPLRARGRALGALALATLAPIGSAAAPRWSGSAASGRREPAELALIDDLAHRAAIAIDNARLYHDIQEADRRKNEFLSMLAHELRNPLAPLLNGIHILRLYGPKQLEVQKVEDMMDRQVQHLVRLVDDLLDISRITRNKIQLRLEAVEVTTIVDRAIEVSRSLLDSRGHELGVTLPTEAVRVNGDPVRLAQVLSNLLNNAAKYTPKGGKIWLSAVHEKTDVIFRVRDNGIGIPADMLSCVFDLFTQVERSLDRSQGGLGIGLTLVRRLVEMHAGTVQAFSAGANQGSEFVIRLPALAETKRLLATGTAEAPAFSAVRRRVLVVDDNPDVAESTTMLLRQIGLEVQTCHDGPSALAVAPTFRPDIVFLDIGLPGMDGYEIARRLRQSAGEERPLLVALSGYGQEEDRLRSQQAGFDHHLVKPANLAELRALLADTPRSPAREDLARWSPVKKS